MSLFEERSNHLKLVNFPNDGGTQPDELALIILAPYLLWLRDIKPN